MQDSILRSTSVVEIEVSGKGQKPKIQGFSFDNITWIYFMDKQGSENVSEIEFIIYCGALSYNVQRCLKIDFDAALVKDWLNKMKQSDLTKIVNCIKGSTIGDQPVMKILEKYIGELLKN
jgi:hypothetical protein